MRILLLTHSFNSLCQRLFVELEAAGHEVSVEFDINDAVTEEAAALFKPDCLVAPFLKRAIPESVWRSLPLLHRSSGHPRRPGAVGARLGDLEGALALGRHRASGRSGNGCGAGLGVRGISDARGHEIQPLP